MWFHHSVTRANLLLVLAGLATVLGCQRTPTPGQSGGVIARGSHFTWQYAGLDQLDAALAAAKNDGKAVLVGLSDVAAG